LKSSGLPEGIVPVVIQDIGPHTDWEEALDGVTEVVHLAASVHVFRNTNRISKDNCFRTNIAGTARLARAAADAGVRRFVFISTIKVFGEGREEPYSEADAQEPMDPYAFSKLEAEHVLKEISCRSLMEAVILRPPLVYGPEVGANFLRLIRLVERQLPMPFASVFNRRSLIFVDNLVDAILTCLRQPQAAGQTYLVADSESLSTPQLISRIAEFLGVASRLFAFPSSLLRLVGTLLGRKEETDRLLGSLVADTARIRKELGWRPHVSINQGLGATIAWYRGMRFYGHRA
jgi:nucleoside-diphosphate-sugar epimerase